MDWRDLAILVGAGVILFLIGHALLAYQRWRSHTGGRLGHSIRSRLGLGLGVDELARRLGVEPDALRAASPRYSERLIPKRAGGTRRLLVPDEATKDLQRRVLHRVLGRLRAHPAAHGFERGRSIVSNALPHVGRGVVVKLDVRDFFPSTRAERVERYLRRIGWNAEAAALLTRLCTWEGGLPQGAPTSPRLSNLVNYFLDVQLTNKAARIKGVYTRYADDLTFSFPLDYPRKMRGIIQAARRVLKTKGYALNLAKIRILRPHQRQRVTGLVVNRRANLPRETRRWLRAAEHRARTGGDPTLSPRQIQGWRSLAQMIRCGGER